MEQLTGNRLAEVGSIVKVGKHSYQITDLPMKPNDMVWNEPAKALDKCICIDGNSIVVEFDSGSRAVFDKRRFQKAVKV